MSAIGRYSFACMLLASLLSLRSFPIGPASARSLLTPLPIGWVGPPPISPGRTPADVPLEQSRRESAAPALWSAAAQLRAGDGEPGDHLGGPVALSGDTALVGAWDKDGGTGVAYVFQHRGSTWTEQAELRAPDRRPGDWFGNAVALDGDTAVVGASLEGNKGAAYIFVRHGNAWIEQAKLTAHDLAPAGWFDRAVAVSGNTALVGAWYHHGAAGAVYVFTREGSTWTEQAELAAADRQADAYFGTSVALGGDTAVVGAAGAQDDSGAAYVFVRGHGRWTQQAELRAPGNPCCATFGTSVALSGATVLVGAGFARGNKGAAYVFTKVGEQWSPRATLLANDGQAGDWFGWTVALSGGTALVGAWYRQGSRGAAYLFVRQGRGWRERAELLAADGKQGDGFGSSVALSGSIGLAGAGFKDHARGGVYVFSTAGTTTVL